RPARLCTTGWPGGTVSPYHVGIACQTPVVLYDGAGASPKGEGMSHRGITILLAAGIAFALPAVVSAQDAQWPEAPPPPASKGPGQPPGAEPQDVEELTPGQIQRAQEPDRPAATTPGKQAVAKPQAPAQPPRTVACSGAFAKGSSHLNLFGVYKDNVVF